MEILFDIGVMLFFLIVLTLFVKPLGTYMTNVFQNKRTLLSPILMPIEEIIYKVAGIKHEEEMDWKDYAKSLLLFNGLGIIVLFLILLLQGNLPLNPQGFPGFPLDLAFNTAVSFVTNTNWQAYSGESAASYLTQMSGLAVQNFLSAATGLSRQNQRVQKEIILNILRLPSSLPMRRNIGLDFLETPLILIK